MNNQRFEILRAALQLATFTAEELAKAAGAELMRTRAVLAREKQWLERVDAAADEAEQATPKRYRVRANARDDLHEELRRAFFRLSPPSRDEQPRDRAPIGLIVAERLADEIPPDAPTEAVKTVISRARGYLSTADTQLKERARTAPRDEAAEQWAMRVHELRGYFDGLEGKSLRLVSKTEHAQRAESVASPNLCVVSVTANRDAHDMAQRLRGALEARRTRVTEIRLIRGRRPSASHASVVDAARSLLVVVNSKESAGDLHGVERLFRDTTKTQWEIHGAVLDLGSNRALREFVSRLEGHWQYLADINRLNMDALLAKLFAGAGLEGTPRASLARSIAP